MSLKFTIAGIRKLYGCNARIAREWMADPTKAPPQFQRSLLILKAQNPRYVMVPITAGENVPRVYDVSQPKRELGTVKLHEIGQLVDILRGAHELWPERTYERASIAEAYYHVLNSSNKRLEESIRLCHFDIAGSLVYGVVGKEGTLAFPGLTSPGVKVGWKFLNRWASLHQKVGTLNGSSKLEP